MITRLCVAGIAGLLNSEPDLSVVAEAADGHAAIRLWQDHRPDVTLLDLRMPGLDGVEVTRAIRAEAPEARIIILTTYDHDEGIYAAVRAGARAFLLKDVSPDDLFDCVRRVHAGETCLTAFVSARVASRLSVPELTSRELEVLRLVAEGAGNREIAARLFVSEVTIKTHVGSVFAKLNAVSRAEAIALAARRGLVRI